MKHGNRGADFSPEGTYRLVCWQAGPPIGPLWGKACPTRSIFRVDTRGLGIGPKGIYLKTQDE
jgi:hypothetical protein